MAEGWELPVFLRILTSPKHKLSDINANISVITAN